MRRYAASLLSSTTRVFGSRSRPTWTARRGVQLSSPHLWQRVECWTKVVELSPTRILIRDQRKRWGSCSADGTLRFNWRLILAPPTLIDYVVVHELLHLRVKNHSRAFWTEMARFMPDYQTRRLALKQIGLRLNIYWM